MTIELGNRLAELRKEHGLSQEELADRLNVSRQAISKWERGEASPDTDNLIELAKIYDVSLDELVGLKNKEEDSVNIHVNKVHLTDDEGGEILIDNNGIKISKGKGHKSDDDDDDDDDKEDFPNLNDNQRRLRRRITSFVSFSTSALIVIAYILLGTLLGLWAQAWVLFIAIAFIPSIFDAIFAKDLRKFAYPVFVVFVYLLLCVWVLGFSLWHPLWVIFLSIPIYYGLMGVIYHKK